MIPAIFGCLFGILGIFTIGIIFVPLAGLCTLVGIASGVNNHDVGTTFIALVAGSLTIAGYAMSPSMWILTAALFGTNH